MPDPPRPPHSLPLAMPDELTGWTSYLVRQAALRAQDEVARALEPVGLRGPHYAVLQVIGAAPCSQAALAARLQTDRTSMVALVDDLERLGLAERRADPADRRAHAVTLTPRGADVLARARAALAAADERLLADFDAPARAAFRASLVRLIATYDGRDDRRDDRPDGRRSGAASAAPDR